MGFLFCWLQIFDTLKSQADNLDDRAQVQGAEWSTLRFNEINNQVPTCGGREEDHDGVHLQGSS